MSVPEGLTIGGSDITWLMSVVAMHEIGLHVTFPPNRHFSNLKDELVELVITRYLIFL